VVPGARSLFLSAGGDWNIRRDISVGGVMYVFLGVIDYTGDNKICNLRFSTNLRGQ
jgi:hypothetical protein